MTRRVLDWFRDGAAWLADVLPCRWCVQGMTGAHA